MKKLRQLLSYQVVGIRVEDKTRDVHFKNLSRETAQMVMDAMALSRFYSKITIEDQKNGAVVTEYPRRGVASRR